MGISLLSYNAYKCLHNLKSHTNITAGVANLRRKLNPACSNQRTKLKQLRKTKKELSVISKLLQKPIYFQIVSSLLEDFQQTSH